MKTGHNMRLFMRLEETICEPKLVLSRQKYATIKQSYKRIE